MFKCNKVQFYWKSLEPRLKFWQEELACIKAWYWSWTTITIHFRPPSLFPSSLSLYIRVQGKANVSLKTNCTARFNLDYITVWLLELTNTFPFSFERKLIQLFSSCPRHIIIWFYQNAEFFESLRRAACILRSVP